MASMNTTTDIRDESVHSPARSLDVRRGEVASPLVVYEPVEVFSAAVVERERGPTAAGSG